MRRMEIKIDYPELNSDKGGTGGENWRHCAEVKVWQESKTKDKEELIGTFSSSILTNDEELSKKEVLKFLGFDWRLDII